MCTVFLAQIKDRAKRLGKRTMSKPVLKGSLWITILRVLLVSVNVFVLLLCLAVFVTGLWARLSEGSYISITGELNLTRTSLALVVVGICATCVSVMGIFGGVILRSVLGRSVLAMYLFVLLLLILSEVAAGVAAIQYRHDLEEKIENSTLHSLNSTYSFNTSWNNASWNKWDQFQNKQMCCGATNYSDFFPIFAGEEVPRSCCKSDAKQSGRCPDPLKLVDTRDSVADIHTTPCLDIVVNHLQTTMVVIAVVAITVSALQLLGIVLSAVAIVVAVHIDDKSQHSYRKLHQQSRGSSVYLST